MGVKKRKKKKTIGNLFGFRNQSFIIFDEFWRSYGQTDLKIRFGIKFCSRCSFAEVCTIKNMQKQYTQRKKHSERSASPNETSRPDASRTPPPDPH